MRQGGMTERNHTTFYVIFFPCLCSPMMAARAVCLCFFVVVCVVCKLSCSGRKRRKKYFITLTDLFYAYLARGLSHFFFVAGCCVSKIASANQQPPHKKTIPKSAQDNRRSFTTSPQNSPKFALLYALARPQQPRGTVLLLDYVWHALEEAQIQSK